GTARAAQERGFAVSATAGPFPSMGVALSGGAIKSETVYAAATIQAAINMTGNPHSRSFCIFVPSLRASWSTERANAGWALDGRRAICAGETRWRHRGATPAYPINS